MQILELTLLTNNLPETKTFYERTIGFEKIEETDKTVSFSTGTSKLRFELTTHNYHPKYHFAFNIPQNKIEEAVKWTSARTKLAQTDNNSFVTNFEDWKAKAIYFFDNNRNILEFISRTDLNNPSNDEFSVKSVLNINEVGLVSEQPLFTGTQIIEKTKTSFFDKGSKSDAFAAVGNDHGLFVISNTNRNWYPTTERSEKWKVRAKIKVGDNEFYLDFNQ